METTTLGRSGLDVSRICLGTWQFGGDWAGFDEREAQAAVRRALELGVTFFDTAQGYGWGESERILAAALGDDINRDEIVVATKGGLRMDDGTLRRDSSPEALREGVESSLRALGVEAIDLYQVHWPDPETPFEETGAALRELVDAGKIRHVGVSNFNAAELGALERTLPVETIQPPYHLFRRELEDDPLPWCREHDVGVLVYGPLAHGLLSGRMSPDTEIPEGDWRHGSPLFEGDAFRANLEAVERLERVAGERGLTVAQLAVAWTLAQDGVHVAIVGARKPGHIDGTAPAGDVRLSDDDLAAIEDAMAPAVSVGGPFPEMGR
jgi:aryl-alcohol dehydrogenase-like predicted oxidoreductase